MRAREIWSARVATIAMTACLAVLSPSVAAAQPGFTVTLGRAFNSVSDPNVPSESRQTLAGTVEAEHVLAAERLRLFYTLDAGNYTTPGDWRYFLNNVGATWRVTLGEKKRNFLYLSGSGSWRTNGTSWAAADYRALGLMANVEVHPSAGATVRFGYRLDAREFPDLAALDQVQHDGFLSALVNLPTRTTLIGEAHLGAKSYSDTVVVPVPLQPSEPISSGSGAGRMGRGMGPSLRGVSLASSPTIEQNQAGLISWTARIAQSLTDRTGASFQYAQRITFGRVAPLVVTTPALYFDDGVYDDPFASDARVPSVTLKHLFAGGMAVEAFASRMLKDYNALLALDRNGAGLPSLALRKDRIWRAGAGWTMPLLPSKTGPLGIDLNVDYLFTRHQSNDAFYNYTSHAIGIGATVSY